MIDRHNRTIDYIRISVTDRCNLRCVYCMSPEGIPLTAHESMLTYDEILRLCRILADVGLTKIKLTGGEPLVRKDLPSLIRQIKDIPGIQCVTLTTNGLLLEAQLESLLQAGLDGVNISIDAIDESDYCRITRGRADGAAQAMAGIKAALACGSLTVKVNCVMLAGESMEHFLSLAELARNEAISVRFIELMPIGLGRELPRLPEAQLLNFLEAQLGPFALDSTFRSNGPCRYFKVPQFRGRVGFISAVSHQFCDRCNRVRLTSEGFLKTCLQYDHGSDLRALLRGGADDSQIREAIAATIADKPDCHQFSDLSFSDGAERRIMSQIGG